MIYMLFVAGAVIVVLLLALWLAYAKVLKLYLRVDMCLKEIAHAELKAEEAEAKALVVAGAHLKKKEAELRADAIKRSAAVVRGKVAEQLIPFSGAFDYNPRDCRFLGAPVDFIVFEGMSEGALDRVVFVEVKTGLSRLSKRERALRDVIDAGEVYYEVLRVDQCDVFWKETNDLLDS